MMMGLRILRGWSRACRTLAAILTTTCLAALSACGGGGGGGGGFLPTDPDADLISYTIELSVVDPNGNPTSRVTDTFPATLRIVVKEDNFNAAPVANLVVAGTAEFAEIAPDNGQALTDADGVATLEIRAGTVLGADTITVTAESPAGQVTASIGVDISGAGVTLGYFDGTSFISGEIGLSSNALPFRGTAEVRLAVVDELGNTITAPRQIRLTSACSLSGLASFRAIGDPGDGTATLTVETVDGLATADYIAGGCEDSDELTAALIDGNTQATATVTIAQRTANFIGWLSSDPSESVEEDIGQSGLDGLNLGRTIIAIRDTGTENRPETARITFEVLEAAVVFEAGETPRSPGYFERPDRRALAGIEVQFALTNDLGGTLLETTAVTNSQGLVTAEVRSGNTAVSTRVTATFTAADGAGSNRRQTATSNEIVIGTGVPDQDSISLSAEHFYVPFAANIDGVYSAITVRLADKFNNPVANGTAATFTTEYGAIDGSCLTGEAHGARYQELVGSGRPVPRGSCTVLWISQAPRFPLFKAPSELRRTIDRGGYDCETHSGFEGPCPDDLGVIRGLRTTIVVTVNGDESFVDRNGNSLYDQFNGDQPEPFGDLPEAFVDHNEDGVYTPALADGERGPFCPELNTAEECKEAGFEETFIDRDQDGLYSAEDGMYNGSLCPEAGVGVFCSRELISVRESLVLTLSSSVVNHNALMAAVTLAGPNRETTRATEGAHEIYISDIYNNSPGVGTTIRLETDGDCQFVGPNPQSFSVNVADNGGLPGAFTIPFTIEDRVQTEAPADPNDPISPADGDTGEGSIFVIATDPTKQDITGASDVLIRTFSCATQGCVATGNGGFSPSSGCPI